MSARAQKKEQFLDELAPIVDGDRDAIARHAEFLADDDEARDLRHEASTVAGLIAAAGADYVPIADLEQRLLAALEARVGPASSERKTEPGFLVDPVGAPAGAFTSVGSERQALGAVRTVEAPAWSPVVSGEMQAPASTLAAASSGPAAALQPPMRVGSTGAAGSEATVVSLEDARARSSDAVRGARRDPMPGSKLGRVVALFGGLSLVGAAAAAVVIFARGGSLVGEATSAVGARSGEGDRSPGPVAAGATTARILEIVRAAGGESGTGVDVRPRGGAFASAGPDASIPAGATVRTDGRTRARLLLSDGSELTLDRDTELMLDASVPRRFSLGRGRILAQIERLEAGPNAMFVTPTGLVEVIGTKFDLSVTDAFASVRVTRGKVRVTSGGTTTEVDQGEEGVLRTGATPEVMPAVGLARAVAWADFGSERVNTSPDDEPLTLPGIGSLRARRPGERQDRERPLGISSASVRVRIAGNVARTEIEQVFQNDGAAELEGIYRFPLPADARVARLALDVNGELEEGAFVARNRARRIWTGVIRNATPVVARRPTEDFIWVPGPWRDPALLEWQRGGNFELRIYPIPARGSRRVVIAYTQLVRPRGNERRYVYPLPVSRDGSTRIGRLDVDVRIAGAERVHVSGYEAAEGREGDAATLRYQATDFVPNGDLVVDYALAGGGEELTYWSYQGRAATAPPERSRDQDREVVEAQRRIAADERGYVAFALRPRLPARSTGGAHDYVIVVDSSQSMVGERFARATRLVAGMLSEMDRRDRFTVLACDYECRSIDGTGAMVRSFRSPTATEVRGVTEWLGRIEPAGASDLGAILRAAAQAAGSSVRQPGRRVHVVYVGDGVATAGHRRAGALAEQAREVASREQVSITTVGIGTDADTVALSAIARAGGGHFVPFVPGEHTGATALSVLETTYGVSLENPSVELPAGLSDVAPSVLPTIRAGEEVVVTARLDRPRVTGELVLRGTVGGTPFEQRYRVDVTPSSAAGNLFVPAQWAASTIEHLELEGRGEDEARIIALSKAYSVMSRHTSLLVLESEAMFRAFGVDREAQARLAWTGEEAAESSVATGQVAIATEPDVLGGDILRGGAVTGSFGSGDSASFPSMAGSGAGSDVGDARRGRAARAMDDVAPGFQRPAAEAGAAASDWRAESRPARAPTAAPAAPATTVPVPPPAPRPPGQWMRRVWVRVGEVSTSNEVSWRELEAARLAEQALAAVPDSRDRHRAAVRALSRVGNVARALEVAEAWVARDRLDPEALVARADLLARSGRRDEALRILTGVVDLRPDDAALQERLANAFERAGRAERACAHRVALAEIDTSQAERVAAAVRCERAAGRSALASILLRSVRQDSVRARIERLAAQPALVSSARGELSIEASWSGGDDVDVALVAPDGTRISWMGGRANVVASGPTAAGTETLGLRSASVGSYWIEVARTNASDVRPIFGTLRVRVLDETRTFPFTLHGIREVVGRATVRREERLEAVADF